MSKRTALDLVWISSADDDGLVDLRLHIGRLCFIADELQRRSGEHGLSAVSENLHLAASLRNLEVDTDLSGTNYMCSSAADHDDALSAVSERHLAGIIVFNLCWNAYEGAVEFVSEDTLTRRPKGALGRDLLRDLHGDRHFPMLRRTLFASMAYAEPIRLFSNRQTSELFRGAKLAAVAAEMLRQFRNDVAHGSLSRPAPSDWGEHSTYSVDLDPKMLHFHHHIRLLLLLIQILLCQTKVAGLDVYGLTDDFCEAASVLEELHCSRFVSDEERVPELHLGYHRLVFNRFL